MNSTCNINPNKKKIFELRKDVNSPQFTQTIAAGRLFTWQLLRSYFPNLYRPEDAVFKEWFDDVSDQYELNNCKIIPKKA